MSDPTRSTDPAPDPSTVRRPRRGERVELTLTDLDAEGRALGLCGEHRIAVRHAVPGSRVVAEIRGKRRRRLEGRMLEVLDPGPHTRPARCEHFGSCGGCSFQTTAYEVQLEQLGRRLREDLDAAGLADGVEMRDVVGMPVPWNYRNKMDFTFGNRRWIEEREPEGVDASFALGLHVAGHYEKVIDIASCAIHFEGADALLASARELAREAGLEPWDNRAGRGLVRHLVLRHGLRTGEVLVNLVTSTEATAEIDAFAKAFLERHDDVTTFVQSVNTRAASIAVGDHERTLFGAGTIRDELLGLTFTISPNAFFQTNTEQAERLVEIVREESELSGGERIVDLYCGGGTFALTLAEGAGEVVGFESVASAVGDARRNALQNGVTNARFVEGDVLETIAGPDGVEPGPELAIVDPPRAGLHPKMMGALARLAARRLVYVSCNPAAAVRDLPYLRILGYRLLRVRPVDLFPHTPHVECVFTLVLE